MTEIIDKSQKARTERNQLYIQRAREVIKLNTMLDEFVEQIVQEIKPIKIEMDYSVYNEMDDKDFAEIRRSLGDDWQFI